MTRRPTARAIPSDTTQARSRSCLATSISSRISSPLRTSVGRLVDEPPRSACCWNMGSSPPSRPSPSESTAFGSLPSCASRESTRPSPSVSARFGSVPAASTDRQRRVDRRFVRLSLALASRHRGLTHCAPPDRLEASERRSRGRSLMRAMRKRASSLSVRSLFVHTGRLTLGSRDARNHTRKR